MSIALGGVSLSNGFELGVPEPGEGVKVACTEVMVTPESVSELTFEVSRPKGSGLTSSSSGIMAYTSLPRFLMVSITLLLASFLAEQLVSASTFVVLATVMGVICTSLLAVVATAVVVVVGGGVEVNAPLTPELPAKSFMSTFDLSRLTEHEVVLMADKAASESTSMASTLTAVSDEEEDSCFLTLDLSPFSRGLCELELEFDVGVTRPDESASGARSSR